MRRTVFLSSEGAGQMRDIIARYVADDNNLRDYEGRYKSYPQLVRDFKGLVSRKYLARIIKKYHPQVAEVLSTKCKAHRVLAHIVREDECEAVDVSDAECPEGTRGSTDVCTERFFSNEDKQ